MSAEKFANYINRSVLEAKGFKVLFFSGIYGTDEISVTVEFKNPNFGLQETVTIPMKDARNGKKFMEYIPNAFRRSSSLTTKY
jgi:hypothetical protein